MQGFRRMAARNKPAGIRPLVYGTGKSKVGIEGCACLRLSQPEHECLFGPSLAVTHVECQIILIERGYVLLPNELWEKTKAKKRRIAKRWFFALPAFVPDRCPFLPSYCSIHF